MIDSLSEALSNVVSESRRRESKHCLHRTRRKRWEVLRAAAKRVSKACLFSASPIANCQTLLSEMFPIISAEYISRNI